ncbi:MAG TPA: FecR domain-containing protein [Gemmatimonadaceae bacterium]|nr:FecR domain-containing protein [Gemmatimonadaceae bacterium]
MPERPPPDGIDGELLGRYLAGESSEAETAVVRRYLMAHPEAAQMLARYLGGLDGAAGRPAAPDGAASWSALRRRMHEGDARAAAARTSGPVGRRRHVAVLPPASRGAGWRRGAAVAACAAGVLLWATYEARRPGEPAPPPPAPRTYTTGVQQRADVRLSDGTRVRVAPGSRLRVAADFGAERRDVYLEGEAYFDVAHDSVRPFTVYAGNASARDIGTAFAVRGYAEDSAVQVVVREGEVALSGVGRLGAGDVGHLTAEGRASVRRRTDVDALLGWLDGRLVFEDAPLVRVLGDVRRWYGVEVELADPALAGLPFTGSLVGVPPRAAVDLVAATLGLRVRREPGGRATLERRAGRTPRGGGSTR